MKICAAYTIHAKGLLKGTVFNFRPMNRPMPAWKIHREAPESIRASKRFVRGAPMAGREIFTFSKAV
jgi:hypothetical protein